MDKKYFIFSDVDGTLFSYSQCGIPKSSLVAIKKARENGHKFFISTGRGKHMIEYEDYKIDIDGYILCNGSHIIVDDHDLYIDRIPSKDSKAIIDLMVKHGIGFLLEGVHENYLYKHGLDVIRNFERKCVHNLDLSDDEADLSLGSHHVVHFNKFDHNYDDFVKINVYFKESSSVDLILNSLSDDVVAIYDPNDTAPIKSIEIMAKGNSKATGIDKIINYYNHPLTQTMALGDGKNDQEMVIHAGIGVAMGNASITLKESADYITDHIDEDGFYHVLKEYKII